MNETKSERVNIRATPTTIQRWKATNKEAGEVFDVGLDVVEKQRKPSLLQRIFGVKRD